MTSPIADMSADQVHGMWWAERTRVALYAAPSTGCWTLEKIAAELGVTPRTLQRRLTAENTSFQGIRVAARTVLAQQYLSDPALSDMDITLKLGYREMTSFHRFIRRQLGSTPGRIRAAGAQMSEHELHP